MQKKFEAKGQLLDSDNQLKFLARKLHSIDWKNRSNAAEQDSFIYEKLEDGTDDWGGNAHLAYLEKANFLLKELGISFNSIMAVLCVALRE